MEIRKITSEDIKRYRNEVLKSSSASTFDRKIFSLKKFFDWTVKEGFVDENPVEEFLKAEEEIIETKLGKIERQRKLTSPSYNSAQAKIIAKLAGIPKLQKLAYHLFYTRPKWYISYHKLPIASYFNYAVLIILMSGLGYGVYNQFFKTTSTPLAYPTSLTTAGRYLSFQGRLTNNLSNPITVSTNMVFKLYNVDTGGTALWDSSTCAITPDVDGIFSTLLGSNCGTEIPASVFSENSAIWLGVTVGTDAEATPRVQIATVAYALNAETLQGYPASESATANTIPAINSSGFLVLGSTSPKIQSTSGNFAIEGQTMTITTPDTSNGSITINPDGTGTLNLTFEGAAPGGSAGGFVNATNANITSGSLYYGAVASGATGYNLLQLQSGATPTNKFVVDYAGNITASGTINGLTISSGTISGATWNGSVIGTQYGGTGQNWSSVAQGSVPYFSGTGTMSTLAPGTSGWVLTTQGTGANPTWTDAGSLGTNYWNLGTGTIYPGNTTLDLLIGNSATTSAKFAFTGVADGTPTASISGSTANVATYLNGNGNLSTTNMNNLTLGSSTTGSVIINSRGVNSITANGNATSIAGTLTLSGNALGSPGDLTINPTGGDINIGASDNLNLTASTNLIFGGTTSLGETTGPTDSGAYVVGANDEFTYSTSTNVQGVLKDFDTKLGTLTGNDFWQLTTNSLSPVNSTYALNVGNTASTSAFFHVPGTDNQDAWFNLGTGKLGVGTTSPTAVLDVAGAASVSGSLTFRTGAGSIETTAMNPLTIGGSTTGNVIINSGGSTALTANGTSLTTGGNLTVGGTTTLAGIAYTWPASQTNGFLVDNGTGGLSWTTTLPSGTTIGFDKITTGTNLSQTLTIGNGSSLTYSGTGIINASTLIGSTWTAPGAIGSVTPNSGAFTTLSSTGATTLGNNTATIAINSIDWDISTTGDVSGIGAISMDGAITGATGFNGLVVTANTGVVTTGTWNGTAIGTQWGGTGANNSTAAQYSVPYYSTTGVLGGVLAPSTAGYVLSTNNTGSAPSWIPMSATGTNYWSLGTGTIYPGNTTLDLLLGASATSSAKFAFTGVNSGTPTASISGTTTNVATYIDGNGNLSTTNMANLTLGSSSAGNVVINSRGSTALTANGANLTAGGNLYLTSAANLFLDSDTALSDSSLNDAGAYLVGSYDDFTNSSSTNVQGVLKDLDTAITGAGVNHWQLNSNVLAPINVTNDLAIGGNATASAKFMVMGTTGNIYTSNNTIDWTLNNAADALNIDSNTLSIDALNNRVGIGTIGPDSPLDVLSTGGTQARLTYTDGSVYTTLNTDSSGNFTIDATGTKTIVADDLQVTGNDILDSAAGTRITLGATTTLTNTTTTLSGTTTMTASSLTTMTTSANLAMSSTTGLTLGENSTINGGSGASGTLRIDSTSNATKGNISFNGTATYIDGLGNLTVGGTTTFGGLTYTWPGTRTAGYVLSTDGAGTLSWVAQSASGVNHWQLNSDVLAPINVSNDLAIGGNATSSAKFQVFGTTGNITSAGTASVSGTLTLGNGSALQSAYGPLTLNYKSAANAWTAGLILRDVSGDIELAGGSGATGCTIANASGNIVCSGTVNGLTVSSGTISGGTWNGTAIGTQYGGTGQNWSAVARGSIPYFNNTGTMSTLAPSTSGYVLSTNGAGADPSWVSTTSLGTNHWQLNSDVLAPINVTNDLAIGGNATSSAKFQVFGATGNASSSGTLTFRGATDPKINILNGENFGIQTSTGGDAGLTERFTILNNGDVGIGTTSPSGKLDVTGGQLVIDDGSFSSPSFKFRGANTGFFRGSDDRIEFVTGGNTALQIYQDQLRVKRGTSGSPGVAWGDSTGTGIFGPTTSTIAFSVNSYEKVRIDSNGNVGINTTSPLSKLSVVGTATNAIGKAAFLVDQYESQDILTASASGQTKMTLKNDGTLSLYNATSTISNTSGDITLDAASNLISFSGDNIGNIGKITASSVINVGGLSGVNYNALAGSGDAPASTAITTNNDVFVGGDLELKGGLYLTGKNIFNVVSGVSTGTITLANDPTLINSYNALSYGSWLVNNSTNNGLAALMVNQSKGGDIFSASSSGTTKFTISNAGNVQINSADPLFTFNETDNVPWQWKVSGDQWIVQRDSADKLVITSTSLIFKQDYLQNNASSLVRIGATAASSELRLMAGGTNDYLTIQSDGDVGIGTTTPSTKLTLYGTNADFLLKSAGNDIGDIIFQESDGNQKARIWTATPAGVSGELLHLSTGDNSADITIDSNGDVAIGTTTFTGMALDVLGTTGGEGIRALNSSALGTGSGGALWTGTTLAPSAADQRIGGLYFSGSNSSSYAAGAAVTGWSGSAWSISNIESYLRFETTPNAGTSRSERMRITSAGNVGIGTTGPNEKLDVVGNVASRTSGGGFYIRTTGDVFRASFYDNGTYTGLFGDGSGAAPVLAIESGNVGIGTTAPSSKFTVDGVSLFLGANAAGTSGGGLTTAIDVRYAGGGTEYGMDFLPEADSTRPMTFFNAAAGQVGSIYTTNTATSFNQSSDLRLKENIVNTNYGLSDLLKISVRDFNFISDPAKITINGFIAQDLYQIYPNAVTPGGDDPGTNPWMVDYGRLTPLLTVSIQQLAGQVTSLSGQVANLSLTSNGDLNINQDPNGNYQLTNTADNSIIGQIAALAQLVAANIQAGAVVTKELTTDSFIAFQGTVDNMLVKSGLVATNIETQMITPLADATDITIQIGKKDENTGETQTGKLSVQNADGNEVASIDTAGDATFSGTLYADDIKSKSLDEIKDILAKVETDQALLAQAADWNINTATDSANLSATNLVTTDLLTTNLYVTGQAAMNSLSLSQSLSIGTDLVFQSTIDNQNSITNSIDTLTSPLRIQSLAMASVEIMAGLIKIDTAGNMIISGDLAVGGGIESGSLSLIDRTLQGLPLQGGQESTMSANLLTLQNAQGNTVSTIDASGSALFKDLTTQGLTIAGAVDATNSAVVDGVITTNATAGSGVIPSGTSEIIIKNTSVTDYTLVYVTPTSSTDNYVLYVKSKSPGEFVVGFTNPIDIDVNFNWWIVRVTK